MIEQAKTESTKPVFMPEVGQPVQGKGVDSSVALVYSDSRFDDVLNCSVYTVQTKSGDVWEVVAGSNFWKIIK